MEKVHGSFFNKNGKVLKPILTNNKINNTVTSIFSESVTEIIPYKKRSLLTSLNPSIMYGVIVALVSVSSFAFLSSRVSQTQPSDKYYIYSSKPLTVEQATSRVEIKDSRAQKINEIFKYYKCPLEGMGEVFVNEADANNIPWYLVASVAFQESSCGKNTPKVNGEESFNAWGWAVYGDKTHRFDNWARGIEIVSKYFASRFFSQGITDTCVIMKTYTPPSNGSWCNGVNEFSDLIKNYQTPTI
jgi:hypothetical protein